MPLLRRDRDEAASAFAAAGRAARRAASRRLGARLAGTGARRVDLPTYAFQRAALLAGARRPPPAPATAGRRRRRRSGTAVDRGDVDDAGRPPSAWTRRQVAAGDGAARARRVAQARQRAVRAGRLALPGDLEARRRRHDRARRPGTWLVVLRRRRRRRRGPTAAERLADARRWRTVAGGRTLDRATLAAPAAETAGERPVDGVLAAPLDEDGSLPGPPGVTGSAWPPPLALVQALGDAGSAAPLWCVTRGAVAAGPGDRCRAPAQAQVWGLGRVGRAGAAATAGAAWSTCRPSWTTPAPLAGWPPCSAGGGEDQVAVRAAGVLGRRLARAAAGGRRRRRRLAAAGTVLVTGGTGALGGHVARWLARGGAEQLVLASRRGPAPPAPTDLLDELARLGAEVTVAACDVADRTPVGRAARTAAPRR